MSASYRPRRTTLLAIVAPAVICLVISAGFPLWLGLTSVRMLADAELDKREQTIGLIGDYMQHLVVDAGINSELLARRAATAPDAAVDFEGFRADAASGTHLKSMAVFDGAGRVIAATPGLSFAMRERIQRLARDLDPATGQGRTMLLTLLPEDRVDPKELPSFVVGRRIEGRDLAVAIEMSIPGRKSRAANLSAEKLDAAFAILDTSETTSIPFGGLQAAGDAHLVLAALAPRMKDTGGAVCDGQPWYERHCASYRRLAGSPFLLTGLVDGSDVLRQWIRSARPVWLFSGVVVLGGIVSSILIYLWARQRHYDRLRLSRALEDTRSAYAAKSNVMAHLAHELRTPLNSIMGFTDMMKSSMFGPLSPRYQEYADIIHRSAAHLLGLATDIMDAERVERGEMISEPGAADLNLVLDEIGRMLSVLAYQRDIALDLQPAPAPVIAGLNTYRAVQVAANLLSNAVKYSEPGDKVVVTVGYTRDGIATLTVVDEGVGMTPQEIDYSQQPFRLPADRRGSRHDSIGLGLPIVRGILASIGGELIIASEKNLGTTVTAVFGAVRARDLASQSGALQHVA